MTDEQFIREVARLLLEKEPYRSEPIEEYLENIGRLDAEQVRGIYRRLTVQS